MITKFVSVGGESLASKKGTSKYFYHNHHLGGVNVVTDIAGTRVQLIEYDPWGAVSRSESTINPDTRFTGQKLDPETGLYYYGGRYYDAEISRFVSPDPFVQEPEEPQSFNRYSYTLNSPQNFEDESGYFFGAIFDAIGSWFSSLANSFNSTLVGMELAAQHFNLANDARALAGESIKAAQEFKAINTSNDFNAEIRHFENTAAAAGKIAAQHEQLGIRALGLDQPGAQGCSTASNQNFIKDPLRGLRRSGKGTLGKVDFLAPEHDPRWDKDRPSRDPYGMSIPHTVKLTALIALSQPTRH